MSETPSPSQKPRRESLAAQAAQLVAAMQSTQGPPKPGGAVRPPNGGVRVRILAITLAAALVVALVYFIGGHWHMRSTAMPPELIGLWRTTAPSHADRPFQFTDSTLVLHTGGTDSTVNRITDVRSKQTASGTDYTIEYVSEGDAYLFSFTLTPGPEPVIRFTNQPAMEWRKQP
jgi:hypothetical protein